MSQKSKDELRELLGKEPEVKIEGRVAFTEGKKLSDNPYLTDKDRWEHGWFASQNSGSSKKVLNYLLLSVMALQVAMLAYLFFWNVKSSNPS